MKGPSEPNPLPPPVRASGISFLEFATDGAHVGTLDAALTGIGFRQVGTHRSKDARLYAQNGLRVVVNSETEGFAHSSYVVHGTNLCALGLRVADPQAAMARAEGLLATPFRQRVGSGELDLPAIRGVGGSLLYLVHDDAADGRQWTSDFVLDEGWDTHRGAGLCAIDHLAQTVRFEDILSWTLFYRSILEVAPLAPVEVPDPGGLVRSQVLQNDDASLRIVLNGSQSSRTLASRFVSQFVGPGVQHVAFGTGDILSTARALKADGAGILPIPANYYDDLDAKYEFAPPVLEELKSLSILYDRDESGEYFQLYLQAFEGGFFIEIVERRGYAGLGAPNAPIRIAGQVRMHSPSLPTA